MKLPQEPRLDPDCNQFKDFLVDHPCLNAKLKGDPHRRHDDSDDDGDRAEYDFEVDNSRKIMTHDSKTHQADIGRSFLDTSS